MAKGNRENVFTDALFDILCFGNGFRDMLALAETQIHSPVFFYDLNYNMIASSPKGGEHTEHLHKAKNHVYLNEAETSRMEKYQVLKDLKLHQDSFIAQDKDNPQIQWLLCAVRVKETFIGYIISPMNGQGGKHHLTIFTLLARALSVEFQKNETFTYKTGIKYSFFLSNLLKGEFETEDEIRTRLQILGRETGRFCHVICISSVDAPDNNEFHRSVEEQARLCFTNCLSVIYEGNIVLFVTDKKSAYEDLTYFQKFERFLKTHGLSAGISHEYTSVSETPGAYQCAHAAMETGIAMQIPEPLFFTKDLFCHLLFRQYDRAMLEQLITPAFKAMEEYDRKNHSSFITTMQVLFRCARNSSLAAQMSGLHRTTYFYRIKTMEERFNIDLSDEQTLFSLEISLKIREYLKAAAIE